MVTDDADRAELARLVDEKRRGLGIVTGLLLSVWSFVQFALPGFVEFGELVSVAVDWTAGGLTAWGLLLVVREWRRRVAPVEVELGRRSRFDADRAVMDGVIAVAVSTALLTTADLFAGDAMLAMAALPVVAVVTFGAATPWLWRGVMRGTTAAWEATHGAAYSAGRAAAQALRDGRTVDMGGDCSQVTTQFAARQDSRSVRMGDASGAVVTLGDNSAVVVTGSGNWVQSSSSSSSSTVVTGSGNHVQVSVSSSSTASSGVAPAMRNVDQLASVVDKAEGYPGRDSAVVLVFADRDVFVSQSYVLPSGRRLTSKQWEVALTMAKLVLARRDHRYHLGKKLELGRLGNRFAGLSLADRVDVLVEYDKAQQEAQAALDNLEAYLATNGQA